MSAIERAQAHERRAVAALAQLNSSSALSHWKNAAELYMEGLALCTTSQQRSAVNSAFKRVIGKAQELKDRQGPEMDDSGPSDASRTNVAASLCRCVKSPVTDDEEAFQVAVTLLPDSGVTLRAEFPSDSTAESSSSIVQGRLPDCSFVSSLIVIMDMQIRLKRKDTVLPSGGMVQFYCHGKWHPIRITDSYLVDGEGECIGLSYHDHATWRRLSLLEKAYLAWKGDRIANGADPGADVALLLSWIPQVYDLRHVDAPFFDHIRANWLAGDTLVMVGVPKSRYNDLNGSDTRTGHAYAVVGFSAPGEADELVLLDPAAGNSKKLRINMRWADLLAHSFLMYVSWSRDQWPHTESLDFVYDVDISAAMAPQILLTSLSSSAAPCLFMLERQSVGNEEPLTAIDAYYKRSKRIFGVDVLPSVQSAWTNGDYNTTSLLISHGSSTIIVPRLRMQQQDSDQTRFSCRATVFAKGPVSCRLVSQRLMKYMETLAGKWASKRQAGGMGSSRYRFNPQYRLTLNKATDVTIILEAKPPCTSTNLALCHDSGNRISVLARKDLICGGTSYSSGPTEINVENLGAGTYILIPSMMQATEIDVHFQVHVHSSHQIHMKEMPDPLAGKFRTTKRIPSATGPQLDIAFEIESKTLCRCQVALYTIDPSARCLIRIAIFDEDGVELAVATGSNYASPPEIDMQKSKRYWLKLSCSSNGGVDDGLEVEALSDMDVALRSV